MVSRRFVLGVGGGAVASGLAGCSAFGEEESGEPARFGRGASAPENPQVVALSDTTAGGRERGRLESSSAVFEQSDGRLVIVSYQRVVAGEATSASGWRYADVSAEHDWSGTSGSLANVETNMTTVDADSPDAAFRLAATADGRRRSWQVVLPEPSAQKVAYRFRTDFDPASPPSEGDELATVGSATTLTDGSLLGGSETVEVEERLVYGDTTVDE